MCIRITVEMQPYCILHSVASFRVAIVSENSITPPICIFTRCDKNEKKKKKKNFPVNSGLDIAGGIYYFLLPAYMYARIAYFLGKRISIF